MRKVEFNTKEEWLEARKACLTGTTVREYIGVQSPFPQKSPEEMAKIKINEQKKVQKIIAQTYVN